MTQTLYLIRHAQPLIEEGRCYGQLDVDADQRGTEQAARNLAVYLLEQQCVPSFIYCSDLKRATQLAHELQLHFPHTPLIIDPRLREMDFGCWEGQAWNSIPKSAYDAWVNNFGDYQFGGRESCQMVLNRVLACFYDMQKVRNDCSLIGREDQHILWITHAGVIRALRHYLGTGKSSITSAIDWPTTVAGFGCWESFVLG